MAKSEEFMKWVEDTFKWDKDGFAGYKEGKSPVEIAIKKERNKADEFWKRYNLLKEEHKRICKSHCCILDEDTQKLWEEIYDEKLKDVKEIK